MIIVIKVYSNLNYDYYRFDYGLSLVPGMRERYRARDERLDIIILV